MGAPRAKKALAYTTHYPLHHMMRQYVLRVKLGRRYIISSSRCHIVIPLELWVDNVTINTTGHIVRRVEYILAVISYPAVIN